MDSLLYVSRHMETMCIYCGSSDILHANYLDSAYNMGALLARRGLTLVFGAGKTGLMGALADGVLENSGEVVGVIPRQVGAGLQTRPYYYQTRPYLPWFILY